MIMGINVRKYQESDITGMNRVWNNVGRCGHICNASYAVDSFCRGQHIGEKLVKDYIIRNTVCFGDINFCDGIFCDNK